MIITDQGLQKFRNGSKGGWRNRWRSGTPLLQVTKQVQHKLHKWKFINMIDGVGGFLFWWNSKFANVHAPKMSQFVHRFQNCFCFRVRTFPSCVFFLKWPFWPHLAISQCATISKWGIFCGYFYWKYRLLYLLSYHSTICDSEYFSHLFKICLVDRINLFTLLHTLIHWPPRTPLNEAQECKAKQCPPPQHPHNWLAAQLRSYIHLPRPRRGTSQHSDEGVQKGVRQRALVEVSCSVGIFRTKAESVGTA